VDARGAVREARVELHFSERRTERVEVVEAALRAGA
jgi:hypothetical protein